MFPYCMLWFADKKFTSGPIILGGNEKNGVSLSPMILCFAVVRGVFPLWISIIARVFLVYYMNELMIVFQRCRCIIRTSTNIKLVLGGLYVWFMVRFAMLIVTRMGGKLWVVFQ